MPTPGPKQVLDEGLDLRTDVAPCRTCGRRRVVCVHGQCAGCHQPRCQGRRGVGREETPVHLCCGWWATGMRLVPWTCPTCQRVYTYTGEPMLTVSVLLLCVLELLRALPLGR